MKKLLSSILFLAVFFVAAFTGPVPPKKLIGNWVSVKDVSFAAPGDTLRFDKKKYAYEIYTWGKFPSGFAFKGDSTFTEYHNINCSEESDEVFYHDERYVFTSDSVINIKGYARNLSFKIVSVSSKKLALKLLP